VQWIITEEGAANTTELYRKYGSAWRDLTLEDLRRGGDLIPPAEAEIPPYAVTTGSVSAAAYIGSVEKFICPYCGAEFPTYEALAAHIETAHPPPPPEEVIPPVIAPPVEEVVPEEVPKVVPWLAVAALLGGAYLLTRRRR